MTKIKMTKFWERYGGAGTLTLLERMLVQLLWKTLGVSACDPAIILLRT